MVPFKNMVYVEDKAQYFPEDEVEKGTRTLDISGTELRRRLQEGADIPEWFSFPAVVAELRRTHPPRHKQGFTVFFTGLSGSGKSTVANALMVKLMEMGGRPVTLLDGDLVRKHLSSELGFSKEHRDLNIQRIGYVASEITKNGGIAICAPIAPYAATRKIVREMIEPLGGFIEIHVATPIEVCEARDRKGLYAKARAGILKGFTGIDDPYEAPREPGDAARHVGVDARHVGASHHREARVARLRQIARASRAVPLGLGQVGLEEAVDEAVVGVELAADFVEEREPRAEALRDDFRRRVARLIEERHAVIAARRSRRSRARNRPSRRPASIAG